MLLLFSQFLIFKLNMTIIIISSSSSIIKG